MSVKHAISRGLEFGRSFYKFGLLKPAGRVAAKFRAEPVRVAGPQPQAGLPTRYRYFRSTLSGLAAQLQTGRFRRLAGGSPRNRAVFLAFGLGVGLIEKQLDDDRRDAATCQGIQQLFSHKKFQSPIQRFTSGYQFQDYAVGKQIGKGSNAAVYEAAAALATAPQKTEDRPSVEVVEDQGDGETTSPGYLGCCSLRNFPLALKMMWNIGAGSSSDSILKSMSHELVPAGPHALKQENKQIILDGHFGALPRTVPAHPNVIRVYRAFTDDVPLLPGAREEYPAVLPARLHPEGMGYNRTLFLVMKNYPCTLRQYLQGNTPGWRQGSLMLLQLLEGVDHLCREGVAHRDLKTDNVLLEVDSGESIIIVREKWEALKAQYGSPRLVISDFGCCLAQTDGSLQLPFNSAWVSRGGNACLMAPEVATAVPGRDVVLDYSKADAWAVGAIAYEIFGEANPFYGVRGLESRRYQEEQLPRLPGAAAPADVRLVVRLLLRRSPDKRPSARVAANILHLSLWGKRALANQDAAGTGSKELVDWLLRQSAVVLLRGCGGPRGNTVEAELQRCFLAQLELEDLRTALGYLLFGQQQQQQQQQPQACILLSA